MICEQCQPGRNADAGMITLGERDGTPTKLVVTNMGDISDIRDMIGYSPTVGM